MAAARSKTQEAMKNTFFHFTQLILLLTAAGKFVGAWRWDASLALADPLLPFLAPKQVIMCAAIAEIAVVIYLSFNNHPETNKALILLWLCFLFLIYRIGLLCIGFRGHCKCLGYWGPWLPVSASTVDLVAQAMLAYMFLGSAGILLQTFLDPEPPQMRDSTS
jgi:hypothetical protein